MKIIYLDILLVINLTVDYLLLFGTARLCGTYFSRLKGAAGAAAGALYSLIIFFDFTKAAFVLTKLAVSAIMVLITFGKRKISDFLRLLVIFYICGFLFSGFMMLAGSFFGSDSFFVKGGIVYFEFTAMEIVLSGTAAFLITEIFRRLFRKKEPEGVFMAKVFYNGKNTVLKGFTDTGNSLSEPFSGSPAAVAKPDSLRNILPENMISAAKSGEMSTNLKIRYIPCKTVAGSVLIPAFRPDKVEIINEKGEFSIEDIMVALSENAPENTLIIGNNVILTEKDKFFSEV